MRLVTLKNALLVALSCLSVWVTPNALSAPVTFNYLVTVSQVGPSLGGAFSLGQILSGSYQFESATSDSAAASTTGLYFNSGNAFSVSNGALSFLANTLDIDISNLASVDIYRVVGSSVTGPTVSGYVLDSIVLSLTDNASATALANDLLPNSPPNLASFNVASFTMAFVQTGTNNVSSVQGSLTALTTAVTPVSVAPSALLLAVGLIALGLEKSLKKSKRPNIDGG